MATIRISEAELGRDLAGVLALVRDGAEVVIQNGVSPAMVLHLAEHPKLRLLSESLRMARERGSTATLDDEFAKDLEAVIASHPEPLRNPWD